MRQHASNHAALCKLRHHFLRLWHNFHRRIRPNSAPLQTSHPAQQRTKQSRPRQNRRDNRPVFLLQHETSPNSPYFCPSTSKSNTPPPIRHPSATIIHHESVLNRRARLRRRAAAPPNTPIPTNREAAQLPQTFIPGKPSETTQPSPQTPDPSPPDQTAAPHPS